MDVITIESGAFKQIIDQIDDLRTHLKDCQPTTPLSELWLDNKEVAKLLRVTPRTLQNYRDQGILPFSQVGSKIYYRASDIQKHLDDHYIKTRNWESNG